MEGHYTRGYGDRSSEPQIHVLDGAYEAAADFLRDHPETTTRLRVVADLLDDWETPYGLELLANGSLGAERGATTAEVASRRLLVCRRLDASQS